MPILLYRIKGFYQLRDINIKLGQSRKLDILTDKTLEVKLICVEILLDLYVIQKIE